MMFRRAGFGCAVASNLCRRVIHRAEARGYIRKLLANERVTKFLKIQFAELSSEFETIAILESL